jgi:hypothetical protein
MPANQATIERHAAGVPSARHWRAIARVLLAPALVLGLVAPAASAAHPMLSIILPRGVQRGGDRELTFQGERLADAEEILFHSDDGLAMKSLTPVDAKSFKAVVHVPEGCRFGEQLVHVRTRSGISEYRSFWVGGLPIVDEQEPNGLPEQAQPVPLGTTVHGVAASEDLDVFVVEMQKGQRLSVEVEALRLGSHRFDPQIAIFDSKRFQIAAADDSPAVLQDGILSVLAPEDGRYFVEVREAAYAGDDQSRYRLHVGGFPRPSAVYPAGGRAGEKVKVTFLGDAAGPIEREIDVPAGPPGGMHGLFVTDEGGTCPSAVPFRISAFGNVLEQEPNNDVATATPADAAASCNGVIGHPGDVDCFRFAATKGQSFRVECYARRLRSGLDPVVRLTRPDGTAVAANDDAAGPDSAFAFSVPEDGDYVLHVTDHLARGQHDFTYRVEFESPTPSLTLSIPRIDRYSQTRQTVFVPRGNRFAVLVNAARENFDGDLLLDGGQLPAGLTMQAPPMKAGRTQVPVIFEAAADAPIAGRLVTLEGRHVTEQDPTGATGIRGQFHNAADFVLGDPNNAVHYSGRAHKLAVAVIDAVPFRVELVQPKAPLVRHGTIDLKVVVTRDAGFAQPVTVEFPFRPQGVAGAPSITIPPEAAEGIYTINADGKAALGSWPVHVIAAADVGGTAWVASPPATLEVVEPFTNASLARASCEQGQQARIACTLEHARPFDGEAVARLQGLPPDTTSGELRFTKDTPNLVFEVVTTDKSPAGNHKTVFVEVVTSVAGEPVRMSGGRTELQITPPAPPAATVAAAPPPAPPPPAEKPLSRLEQLRQQAGRGGPRE